MLKVLVLFFVLFFPFFGTSQIFMAKTSEISFFSKTDVEDIDAKNTTGKPVLDAGSGKVAVKVTMRGFKFKSGFMEDHFNENYVESDKYPHAIFEGKIKDNDKINYKADGEYDVIVEGKMTLHGQTKDIVILAKLTIKGNQILVNAKFKLAIADYKIEIPAQKLANIAEQIDVTVKATLEPFKK